MSENSILEDPARLAAAGLLLTIVMLGMSLRLWQLGEQSFWHDEIITATESQQDVESILHFHRERAGNPPLLFLITHFSFACWGHTELTARLPAALFGTLSILLTYALGQMLWTKTVGLIAAFLLALNAYHVQYSQEARHYSLMAFLALLSLIFLVKALETNKISLWVGFVLCTALSLYNHYFAFLFLPAEVVFGAWVIAEKWLSHRRGGDPATEGHPSGLVPSPARQGLMFCLSLSLVGMSYLPWISTLRAQFPKQLESPTLGVSTVSLKLSLDFLREVLVAYGGASGAVLLLWLGLFLWGMVTCGRKRILLVILWMVAPFAFVSVINTAHFLHPRYLLFILPLWLLLTAKGVTLGAHVLDRTLAAVKDSHKYLAPATAGLTALVLAAFSVMPLAHYYAGVKADWRGVAQYLVTNMRPGDLVLADGAGYFRNDSITVEHNLSYYLPRLGTTYTPILQVKRGLAQAIAERPPDASGEVWAVLLHRNGLGTLKAEEAITTADFRDVSIIRLRQPSLDPHHDQVIMLYILTKLLPAPEAHFDIHLALAEMYLEMGKTAEAAMHVEQAARRMPARRRARLDLADAYRQQGRLQDAVTQYLMVLQPQSGQAPARWERDAYLHLGSTYERLGRLDEAIAAYQEVLRIYPAHTEARRRLRMLSVFIDEDIQHRLWRSLGLRLAFLGYDLRPTTASARHTLDLTLWWQGLATMDRDYTVFVHLTDPDDRLWAQEDKLLEHDGHSTSIWEPGVVVKQEFQLHLPPDIPLGEYTVKVGVYYWQTGERLPVWDENGQRAIDDTILLETIVVTE